MERACDDNRKGLRAIAFPLIIEYQRTNNESVNSSRRLARWTEDLNFFFKDRFSDLADLRKRAKELILHHKAKAIEERGIEALAALPITKVFLRMFNNKELKLETFSERVNRRARRLSDTPDRDFRILKARWRVKDDPNGRSRKSSVRTSKTPTTEEPNWVELFKKKPVENAYDNSQRYKVID